MSNTHAHFGSNSANKLKYHNKKTKFVGKNIKMLKYWQFIIFIEGKFMLFSY